MGLIKIIKFEYNFLKLKRILSIRREVCDLGFNPNPYIKELINRTFTTRKPEPVKEKPIQSNVNQPKSIISIVKTFWPIAYPKWDSYTEQQKAQLKNDKLQQISDAVPGFDVKIYGPSIKL